MAPAEMGPGSRGDRGVPPLGFLDVGRRGLRRPAPFLSPLFRDFYLGWLNFETRCGAGGTRVAYAGTDLPYYFLGQGLRNEVRYINIDRHRDWLLHDYHREALSQGQGTWPNSRPGWDRIRPRLSSLARQPRCRGHPAPGRHPRQSTTRAVHNIADAERFPIEKVWADSHPERFQPLYGQDERDPWFRIYRVRRH